MSEVYGQDESGTPFGSASPEAILRALFESAPYGHFLSDPQGRCIAVNPAGAALTGFTRDQILGMALPELLAPAGPEQSPREPDSLQHGRAVRTERLIRRKDGSLLPVELSTRMLPGGNLLTIVRDISERRQTKADLEQRVRELAALQKLGLAVSTSLSWEQIWLAALESMLETVPADLSYFFLREGERLILQGVLPEQARRRLGDMPEHRVGECLCGRAVREGRPLYARDIESDPRCTWEECKRAGFRSFAALPVRAGQEVFGVIGLASESERDFETQAGFLEALVHQVSVALANARLYQTVSRELEERKRAEAAQARLGAILEKTSDLVLTATPDGQLTYLNQAGRRMVGWGDEEPLEGRGMADLHPAWAMRKIETEGLPGAAAAGHWEGEAAVVRRGGQEIPVSQVILAHRSPGGDVQFFSAISRNITERWQAERALRESEEKYRRLVETTGTGYGIMDEQGRLLEANHEYLSLTGRRRLEDILGHPVWEWVAPHDRERCARQFRRCIEEGAVRNVEADHTAPDGRIIPIEASLTAFPSREGLRILGLAWNISGRRQAERALRRSEEQVRLALQAASQGLYDLNIQTGEAQVSPEYATMLGYDPADFHETNAAWIDRLHPDDRAPVAATYRDYIAGRIPEYRVEFRQRTRSGDWKWILSLGKVVERDSQGRPLRMLGTHTDITERKRAEAALRESEEKLRRITDNMRDLVVQLDAQGRYEYVSPSITRSLRFQPEDLLGKCAFDSVHPEDRDRVIAEFQAVLATGEPGEVEYRRADAGGKTVWFQSAGSALRDPEGKIAGMVVTSRDITERKRAEEENQKLQAQLARAQRMESIGRLAGGVAHDFNNMLTAILGFAELALAQVDPSQPLCGHLERIRGAALRSADLTRQLLAFARRQPVAPKVLELNETVDGMLKMLHRLIGEDISLAWLPGRALWPVKIDPSQIDQILTNLAVNARDAITGIGKLTIETHNVTLDAAYCAEHPGFLAGDYVMLAVSDDGCGMDRETLEHLFEPFFTTKAAGQGTGLGLATIYGIVKQNDGFVNVYSEPGVGSTFKIYLPRYRGGVPQTADEGPPEGIPGGVETLLLVEDEAAILNMGKAMLELLGYTVLCAGRPSEAIRLAQEHAGAIDLLITDVVMPEMNGRELCRRLLAIHPNLKSLYMSGYMANVIAHHGILEEGVHFLQKPFSLQDIAAKVRQALGTP